jgi:hypothetical protein
MKYMPAPAPVVEQEKKVQSVMVASAEQTEARTAILHPRKIVSKTKRVAFCE